MQRVEEGEGCVGFGVALVLGFGWEGDWGHDMSAYRGRRQADGPDIGIEGREDVQKEAAMRSVSRREEGSGLQKPRARRCWCGERLGA